MSSSARLFFIFGLLLLAIPMARASVYSPSSVEVHFAYSAQFLSDDPGTGQALALEHAKYLFGYLQNPEIVAAYKLNDQIAGIASPRWEPQISNVTEVPQGRDRLISYSVQGLMLINRHVAASLFAKSSADGAADWKITLPYRLDFFFDKHCNDPDYPDADQYWYVYDPFRAGCTHLRRGPLAHEVALHLTPVPQLDANAPVDLDSLRGDNGNGDVFEITSIAGFYDDSAAKTDDGRAKFAGFNKWLETQGFKRESIYQKKNRELYVFTKSAVRRDGHEIQIRVVRLLAPTEIDETEDRTFARFVENALYKSDVVVYDGHSGMGVNLSLEQIASRAGAPVRFNATKKQLFYFASCSSYAYYLGLFTAQKPAGTLAVMTNGLEADFLPPVGEMRAFFSALFDTKQDSLTWGTLLQRMDAALKGDTYMVNVSIE